MLTQLHHKIHTEVKLAAFCVTRVSHAMMIPAHAYLDWSSNFLNQGAYIEGGETCLYRADRCVMRKWTGTSGLFAIFTFSAKNDKERVFSTVVFLLFFGYEIFEDRFQLQR